MEAPMVYFRIVLIYHKCYSVVQRLDLENSFMYFIHFLTNLP
jgi:hypothetical protein